LELDKDGKVRYSAAIPLIAPGDKEKTEKTEILTTPINNVREGRDKLRHVAGKSVEGGKVQQMFFSEDLAKKCIQDFMEVFLRSPENPLLANVIVVEGSPYELMKSSEDFEDKPRPTFYVNGLLVSGRRNSYIPETRISNFTILTHSGTIDPTTPLIRFNKKEIQITGTALFSGDKMVGKIKTEAAGLLLALMGESKDINYLYQGPYSTKDQEALKNGIIILMKNKNRKIKINIEDNKPIIDINLYFKGFISEHSGELDLAKSEDQTLLEEEIAHSIEKDCVKLLKYLVEVGADPIGFGEIVRTKHNQHWRAVNWKEIYKDASFKVKAKIEIESYGAMDNP
jgi:Ger(x)C family germination protein